MNDEAPDSNTASEADARADWLSFEHEGDTWMFDLTFLRSNWTCIFGAGCRGVMDDDATELGHGCCSHGAHFADKADRKRVKAAIAKLDETVWQFHELAEQAGGAICKDDDGGWVTRTHDGACIMLNRADFGTGVGCALHFAALERGERPLDVKPEVCWQLPLRLTHHVDEVEHCTQTLREWKRRDWGDGGVEFHWWCTEGPEAFVGGNSVLESMSDEIREMVGNDVYERLCEEVELRGNTATPVPHPAVRPSAG
ncbi:MAG: hypothetical protein ACR2OH_02715 [Microthrixaceae bacterium]